MLQLILHLFGDYVTQSDWMANNKRKSSIAAGAHALIYSLPFLLLRLSPAALAVIFGTHFLIDRFGLARYVVYAKNRLLQPDESAHWTDEMAEIVADEYPQFSDKPLRDRLEAGREWERKWSWKNCSGTGYPSEAPPWLAVWLLIAADNTIHIAINYTALTYL